MFLDFKYKLLLDEYFYREHKRESIKDPILLLEQEKIWAIEDAAEKISDAINSSRRSWF